MRDPDAFRPRSPGFERWTPTTVTGGVTKSWEEMLEFVNSLDPERIVGYRIQVNWKREAEEKK